MKAQWITWNNKTNTPTTSDTLNGIQMVPSKQQRSTVLWKSNGPPPPLSSHRQNQWSIQPHSTLALLRPSFYYLCVDTYVYVYISRYGCAAAFVTMHKWNVRIQSTRLHRRHHIVMPSAWRKISRMENDTSLISPSAEIPIDHFISNLSVINDHWANRGLNVDK